MKWKSVNIEKSDFFIIFESDTLPFIMFHRTRSFATLAMVLFFLVFFSTKCYKMLKIGPYLSPLSPLG